MSTHPTDGDDRDLDLAAAEADYARLERNEAERQRSILGITARAEAASPGPWHLSTEQDDAEFASSQPYPYAIHGPINQSYADVAEDSPLATYRNQIADVSDLSMADAEFLAHAREDIPRLLAAAEALIDLVLLKDGPRGQEYEKAKPLAWQAARAATQALLPDIDPLPSPEVFDLYVQAMRGRIARMVATDTTTTEEKR
jgi:hypothetical protein